MLSRHFFQRTLRVSVKPSLGHRLTRNLPQVRFNSSEQSTKKGWSAPTVIGAVGVSSAGFLAYGLASRKDPQPVPANVPAPAPFAEASAAALPSSDVPNSDQVSQPGQIPNLDQLGQSLDMKYLPAPGNDDVTQQLNEHAFSLLQGSVPGVGRYDGAQLASNSPCEDNWMHGTFSNPLGQGNWMAWAVFDGHCGWQMSNHLTTHLMPYVQHSLGAIRAKDGSEPSEEAIGEALKSAFTTLDDALVKTAKATIESNMPFPEKARRLEVAYAGACALLALYDPTSSKLRIASTGDCRAVQGRKDADGKWTTTELTVDQTGANPDEAARIQALFPDEPNIVKGGRVWGMQPSRTFGDGMWKWSSELKTELRNFYNGLSLPSGARYADYKVGPYLTAEPAITTADVPTSGPSFLIIATDGLWDSMSSEEAVDLVGRWIDWQAKGGHPEPPKSQGGFGTANLGHEQACTYDEKRAALQDPNVAVHLMRNGLGGVHEEMIRGALTFRYPNSRDIRDDMTIQVILFNQTSNSGQSPST